MAFSECGVSKLDAKLDRFEPGLLCVDRSSEDDHVAIEESDGRRRAQNDIWGLVKRHDAGTVEGPNVGDEDVAVSGNAKGTYPVTPLRVGRGSLILSSKNDTSVAQCGHGSSNLRIRIDDELIQSERLDGTD
ncbi:hypothetical protein P7C73_g765, partial [Tremellales sp. Uapishka_1]